MWTPKAAHKAFFEGSDKWNVFVAELLHSKTPHIKDQLYIFDQIVADGVQLIGTTFAERQAMLRQRWPNQVSEPDQLRVHEYVSLAKNYKAGFAKLFSRLKPEDEGLVLKDPNAKLEACVRQDANNSWQVKSRIPHANYSF